MRPYPPPQDGTRSATKSLSEPPNIHDEKDILYWRASSGGSTHVNNLQHEPTMRGDGRARRSCIGRYSQGSYAYIFLQGPLEN